MESVGRTLWKTRLIECSQNCEYNSCMPNINQISLWWKIAAVIVGVLILVGIGLAFQRKGGMPTSSIFGIQSAPSLTRNVQYASTLDTEVRKNVESLIGELRAKLQKDDTDYEAWLTLAIRYKQAEDYDKAREVWEYLASIHPDDSVSRHNLGDLYHHFLKDYAKAETYYKEALERAPTNSLEYLALHELYRYSLKQDTTAAEDILKQGIELVTENQPIDLYVALGSYYVAKGEKEKAIESYTKTRDLAQKARNTGLVAQLNAEIAKLR